MSGKYDVLTTQCVHRFGLHNLVKYIQSDEMDPFSDKAIVHKLLKDSQKWKMTRDIGPLTFYVPGMATTNFMTSVAKWVSPRTPTIWGALSSVARASAAVPVIMVGTPMTTLIDSIESLGSYAKYAAGMAPEGAYADDKKIRDFLDCTEHISRYNLGLNPNGIEMNFSNSTGYNSPSDYFNSTSSSPLPDNFDWMRTENTSVLKPRLGQNPMKESLFKYQIHTQGIQLGNNQTSSSRLPAALQFAWEVTPTLSIENLNSTWGTLLDSNPHMFRKADLEATSPRSEILKLFHPDMYRWDLRDDREPILDIDPIIWNPPSIGSLSSPLSAMDQSGLANLQHRFESGIPFSGWLDN